jgi:hypothetical protein
MMTMTTLTARPMMTMMTMRMMTLTMTNLQAHCCLSGCPAALL